MAENVRKLFEIVESGDVARLEAHLVENTLIVNKFNEHQQTALIRAAGLGNLEIVQALIRLGADVDTVAMGYSSALMLAVENQHKEVVKVLLKHNADSSNNSKVGGGTVLARALKMNLWDVADVLLRHGVDINARDKMGLTVLMYAAMEGNYREVKYLLDKGANKDLSCSTLAMMGQKTALLTAAMNDHTNVVRLLLDRGATILPPHYREFKERSVVEETAAAQECSELLRRAFRDRDPSRRENAVDLTAVDASAVLPPPPVQSQSPQANGESPAEGAAAGRGRGRGWHCALPSWLTSTSAGDLLPRNCETMSDYQLYQQGLLEPPKRGPRFRLRDPNAVVDVSGPVPGQFADAAQGRTSGSGSDRNDPIQLVESPHGHRARGDSRGRGHERGPNTAGPDRGHQQGASDRPAWDRGNRPERSRSRDKERDSYRDQGREQTRGYNNREFVPPPRSPPRFPDRNLPLPPSDNPNIMINYASVYTPKPPRPRQCKPLLPEPVTIPDVDFDRSCGNQLKPPREVNSYAEQEKQRRQQARDNPVVVPMEAPQQKRRSPSPPPAPRRGRAGVEEDDDVVLVHRSELQGAGRGRNHTLPAWMTAGTSFERQLPPVSPRRDPSPPQFASRDMRGDVRGGAERRRETVSPTRAVASTSSRGHRSPPRDIHPPRDARYTANSAEENNWAAVSAPQRGRSPPRAPSPPRGPERARINPFPEPAVRAHQSPPREPPPREARSNTGWRGEDGASQGRRSPPRPSSPPRSFGRGQEQVQAQPIWTAPATNRGPPPRTRSPSPPPREETTGRVLWRGREEVAGRPDDRSDRWSPPRAFVASQAPVRKHSPPPRDMRRDFQRGREETPSSFSPRQAPSRDFPPPRRRAWAGEDTNARGDLPPHRGPSPERGVRAGRDLEAYFPPSRQLAALATTSVPPAHSAPGDDFRGGAGRGRSNTLPAWMTQQPPRSPPASPRVPPEPLQTRFASSVEVTVGRRGSQEPPSDAERYPRQRQRSISPPPSRQQAREPPRMDSAHRERSSERVLFPPARRSPPRRSFSRERGERGAPQPRFDPATGPPPRFAPPPSGPPPPSSLKHNRGDEGERGAALSVPDVGSFRAPKRPRVGSELDHPFSSSTPQLSYPPAPPQAAPPPVSVSVSVSSSYAREGSWCGADTGANSFRQQPPLRGEFPPPRDPAPTAGVRGDGGSKPAQPAVPRERSRSRERHIPHRDRNDEDERFRAPPPSQSQQSQQPQQPRQQAPAPVTPEPGDRNILNVPDVGSFRAPRQKQVAPEPPITTAEPSRPPPVVTPTAAPAPERGGWRSETPAPKRVFSMAELQQAQRARGGDQGSNLIGAVAPLPAPAQEKGVDRLSAPPSRASVSAAISPPPLSVPLLTVPTWMRPHLVEAKLNTRWVATCERVLVQEQGVATREMYASLAADYFSDAHLAQLGLKPLAVQLELRNLHTASQGMRGAEGNDGGSRVAVEARSLHVYSAERDRSLVDAGTGMDVDGTGTLCSDTSVISL